MINSPAPEPASSVCKAPLSSSSTFKMYEDDLSSFTSERMMSPSPSFVRFNLDDVVVHPVERLIDMPQVDVDAKWYDRGDYDIIKAQNNLSLKLMQVGRQNPEESGHCYRGLEYRQQAIKKRRRIHRQRVLHAVMHEQQRQRETEIQNSELLATVYQGYVNMCEEAASTRGTLDAEAASVIFQEPSAVLVTTTKEHEQDFLEFDVVDDDDISVLSDGMSDASLRRFRWKWWKQTTGSGVTKDGVQGSRRR
jgi:hypothetical protein